VCVFLCRVLRSERFDAGWQFHTTRMYVYVVLSQLWLCAAITTPLPADLKEG
jgi:hypothetical protein